MWVVIGPGVKLRSVTSSDPAARSLMLQPCERKSSQALLADVGEGKEPGGLDAAHVGLLAEVVVAVKARLRC
jgi:hypothetical protein